MSLFWMNKLADESESSSGVKIKWHQLQPLPKGRNSSFFWFEAFSNGKTRELALNTRNEPLIYWIFTLKNILGMEVPGSGCTVCNNSKVLNIFSFWPPAPQQKEIGGVTEGFLFLPGTAKSSLWKNLVHREVIHCMRRDAGAVTRNARATSGRH